MTENEAIVQLNFDMEMIRFNHETGETLTLEQIKAHYEENYKTYLADEIAITALKEIQQYRAIGTVEECTEAVLNIEHFYMQGRNKAIGEIAEKIEGHYRTYKTMPSIHLFKDILEEMKGGE